MPLVAVLMGSDSDLPAMAECARVLKSYEIPYEIEVLSAHRSPDAAVEFVSGAARRGVRVVIAGAGASAHLAGVAAAHTALPVIGVPLAGSPLGGIDALLSTVQMPPGVPVATMGVGTMGAKNAGQLAARILALSDAGLARRVQSERRKMTRAVLAKRAGLKRRLEELLGGE